MRLASPPATSRSSSSPARWPCLSLTDFRSSTSMNAATSPPLVRRARSISRRISSSPVPRRRAPVSSSTPACFRSLAARSRSRAACSRSRAACSRSRAACSRSRAATWRSRAARARSSAARARPAAARLRSSSTRSVCRSSMRSRPSRESASWSPRAALPVARPRAVVALSGGGIAQAREPVPEDLALEPLSHRPLGRRPLGRVITVRLAGDGAPGAVLGVLRGRTPGAVCMFAHACSPALAE